MIENEIAIDNSKRLRFELGRKVNHVGMGILFIFILFYFGRIPLLYFLIVLLLTGSIIIFLMHRGRRMPIASWMVDRFEREEARFPGYGAFWYVVGSLLLVLSVADPNEIASAVVVLALGDAAATLFGIRNGRHRHRYNPEKTVEGTAAFFIFSLPACIFSGWEGAALAALGAIVESLPLPVDDNLTIPLAAILFFSLAS